MVITRQLVQELQREQQQQQQQQQQQDEEAVLTAMSGKKTILLAVQVALGSSLSAVRGWERIAVPASHHDVRVI